MKIDVIIPGGKVKTVIVPALPPIGATIKLADGGPIIQVGGIQYDKPKGRYVVTPPAIERRTKRTAKKKGTEK